MSLHTINFSAVVLDQIAFGEVAQQPPSIMPKPRKVPINVSVFGFSCIFCFKSRDGYLHEKKYLKMELKWSGVF